MKKLAFASALALLAGASAFAADVTVDFGKTVGKVNPKLHSAGWAPRTYPRAICNDDADLAALNLYACRTHDWALVNSGQRTIDTQYVFPLMHLDAKDPKNYFFAATDESLRMGINLGMKIFYRLGTSIEHTEGIHFNALAPTDYEKYAEALAGIMRHYLKGWGNGFKWAEHFDGWEIWNEPDGITNCWVLPDCNEPDWKKRAALHQTEFCKFFAIVLKRLKSEFPDQQVGGPALCWANDAYFTELLDTCQKAGVTPDFISWHGYTSNPDDAINGIKRMRKLLDDRGLQKVRTIFNEWHYIRTWNGIHGRNSTVAAIKRAHEGPTGHLNIDSGAMNLYMLCKFQESALDEAFYYGSGVNGNWGYKNGFGELNKCWYSMKMFGDFVRATDARVETTVATNLPTVAVCAGLSKDGKTGSLVVADYRGNKPKIDVAVKGIGNVKRVSACVLDHTRDMAPVPVLWQNGAITLSRADENSAAFLVTFEK